MSRPKSKLPSFKFKPPSIERLLLFVLATLNAAGQGVLLFSYSRDWIASWIFIGALCAASVFLLTLALIWRRRGETAAYLIQMAFWSFFAGPFGATVVWGLGLVGWTRRPTSADYGEWLDGEITTADSERIDRMRNDLLDRRLRIEGASEVVPLTDVIAEGDQRAKFDTLNVIGRYFDPSMTPALRLAAYDADPSVRVLAATVLAKLQTQFTDKHTVMKRLAGVNDVQAWRQLAQAHLEFAASGLLEPAQTRDERMKARTHLEHAISLAPLNDGLRLEFVTLLIDLGDDARALAQLDQPWTDADARDRAAQLRARLTAHQPKLEAAP